MSLRSLARRFGKSPEGIRLVLRGYGIQLRGGDNPGHGPDDNLWRMGYESAKMQDIVDAGSFSEHEQAAMRRILNALRDDPLCSLIPLTRQIAAEMGGLKTSRLLRFARGAAFYHRSEIFQKAVELLCTHWGQSSPG